MAFTLMFLAIISSYRYYEIHMYGLLCPLILLYGRGSVSRKRSAADSVIRRGTANAYLTVPLPRLALKR